MIRSVSRTLLALPLTATLPSFAAEGGKPAPAFTLQDESGTAHSLEQYKGKLVVLEWTNPECPYVKRHYEADTRPSPMAAR